MNLSLYTTCVNYADYLEETLKINHQLFDKILVSTTTEDADTDKVCSQYVNVHLEKTDAFSRNGAKFNKSEGLNEILRYIGDDEWVVIGDSDCIYPPNIKYEIQRMIDEGRSDDLFSFPRIHAKNKKRMKRILEKDLNTFSLVRFDRPGMGYCQIFNSSSPVLKGRIRYKDISQDADSGDMDFAEQWDWDNRHYLQGLIVHIGEEGKNWQGRITSEWT